SDEWPLLFWVLEDYDTLKLTLEKGADVNVKYETQISVYEDGIKFYTVNQNAGMYLLDHLKRHMESEDLRKAMNLLLDYGLDMDYKDERGNSLRDYARDVEYDLGR
nr:hypothetical protein [Lachnospiraceae bacterium]